MENQTNQTNSNLNSGQNSGTGSNQPNGNNQQEEMMKMLAAGYDMLQTNAARVPELLSTAGTAVVNGVKNMSTTRKVIAGSVLAVGAALLVGNQMRKGKSVNGDFKNQPSKKNKR